MYNVRKCPNCGGNVPEGNEVCYNCGHKMGFFGGKGLYVAGSKNANTISGGNPFESRKKNNSGCLGVFLIFLFFILPVISVIYEFYQEISYDISEPDYEDDEYEENAYSCSSLCRYENYKEQGEYCLCDNGNIYNSTSGMIIIDKNTKCEIYCDGSAYHDGEKCACSNGKYYSLYGVELNNTTSSSEKTVSEWYSDVTSGKAVITILCESYDYNCKNYKPAMENLVKNRKINLYYFDIDKLDETDKTTLTTTYTFKSNQDLKVVPYTFFVKDNQFVTSTLGYPTNDHVEVLIDIYDFEEE